MIYHLISKSMYQADVLSAYYIFPILMGQDKPHFMFWYFFWFFFCLKITLFVIFRAKTKKLNKNHWFFKFFFLKITLDNIWWFLLQYNTTCPKKTQSSPKKTKNSILKQKVIFICKKIEGNVMYRYLFNRMYAYLINNI